MNGLGDFWTQAEWAEWSNDLARLIPEGDERRYSNPEGSQELIIEDCLRAYVAERAPSADTEKQFLVCRNCGESFGSIIPAHEHGTADLSGSAGWCGDDGFDIVPESEAF